MRSVVVLALTLLAAGCGWLDRQPDAPAPTPAPAGAPEPESATAREALPSLAAVLAQIEGGNFSRAERMLARLGEHDAPPIGTAMLREQLREAPERLLPGPYREVVVEPGETLSEIAGRELGNPLLFIALARLNQIEVPRRVAVGTLLRVPDRSPAVPGGAETPAVETADPADDVLTVSDYLFSSGQEQSALRLLRGALAEKPDSARLQRRLVEASLEAAHWPRSPTARACSGVWSRPASRPSIASRRRGGRNWRAPNSRPPSSASASRRFATGSPMHSTG